MELHETIICATAPGPSTPNAGAGAVLFHDFQTSTQLASFKQTTAEPHSTVIIPTRNSLGGLIIASQADKSLMHVYNFQKDQIALKVVLPEKLSCIAVDPKSLYCAAGTSHGRIFFWELASGIMFNAWDGHYRRISVLTFSRDGSALFSGSDDSGVNVWFVSRLVDSQVQAEVVTPYCTLSDHTLPIKDIVCGVGMFPTCRVFTSSLDHTVKIWDMESKSLLTTFHFPNVPTLLAIDITERTFFAGSPDGNIHQVNLFRRRDRGMEAVGGGGVTDIVRIEMDDGEASKRRLISVGQPITALTLSITNSCLLVGTDAGAIHIYDVPSHQLLRSITAHAEKGFRITHLETILRPPDLIGHISLSLDLKSASDAVNVVPTRPIQPLQRTRDAKARETHEVVVMLPGYGHEGSKTGTEYTYNEALQDSLFFTNPSSSGSAAQARVAELEAEVTSLRDQLGRAKGVNDVMWETVVQQVVSRGQNEAPKDAKENRGAEADLEGRKKKRSRV